jgi:hypothetical protein
MSKNKTPKMTLAECLRARDALINERLGEIERFTGKQLSEYFSFDRPDDVEKFLSGEDEYPGLPEHLTDLRTLARAQAVLDKYRTYQDVADDKAVERFRVSPAESEAEESDPDDPVNFKARFNSVKNEPNPNKDEPNPNKDEPNPNKDEPNQEGAPSLG